MQNLTDIDHTLTKSGDIRCWTVNMLCSDILTQAIYRIQKRFIDAFGDDVFCPKGPELHMTLLNWIDPFISYPRDKGEVFHEIRESCSSLMREILSAHVPFSIAFHKLEYRGNCIILEGFDQGECATIRNHFLTQKVLPKENHQPPRDIHITFLTFRKAVDKSTVLRILDEETISILEQVDMFRLSFCPKPRMQEHTEMERFYFGRQSSLKTVPRK